MKFQLRRASASYADEGHVIEIEDLDALIALMRREGSLVIRNNEPIGAKPDDLIEILIYDDYIE